MSESSILTVPPLLNRPLEKMAAPPVALMVTRFAHSNPVLFWLVRALLFAAAALVLIVVMLTSCKIAEALPFSVNTPRAWLPELVELMVTCVRVTSDALMIQKPRISAAPDTSTVR